MYFEIVGEIEGVEAIAIGRSIRDIARLRRRYDLVVGESSREGRLSALEVARYIEQSYTGMKPTELVK